MGVYRQGPAPGELSALEQRILPRRAARAAAGLAAVPLAFWIYFGRPPLWIPAAILAAVWLVARLLPLRRRLAAAGMLAPVVGATLLSTSLREVPDAMGLIPHGIMLVGGVLFATSVVRRAPDRLLAQVLLVASFVSVAFALFGLASMQVPRSADASPFLVPSYADLGLIPLEVALLSGVPHLPVLLWLLGRRHRREAMAAAETPAALGEGNGHPAPHLVREIHRQRAGRIAAAAVLLAGVAITCALGVSVVRQGVHPDELLVLSAMWTLLVAALTWPLAVFLAGRRFDRLVARGGAEAALLSTRRLEYASITLPLAAWMFLLPTVVCSAFAFIISDYVDFMPGRFIHVSLLCYFPVHAMVVIAAMEYGWAVQTRPTGELDGVVWPRALFSWLTTVISAAIWANALGAGAADVVTVVFLGGLACIVTLYSSVTRILKSERAVLDR